MDDPSTYVRCANISHEGEIQRDSLPREVLSFSKCPVLEQTLITCEKYLVGKGLHSGSTVSSEESSNLKGQEKERDQITQSQEITLTCEDILPASNEDVVVKENTFEDHELSVHSTSAKEKITSMGQIAKLKKVAKKLRSRADFLQTEKTMLANTSCVMEQLDVPVSEKESIHTVCFKPAHSPPNEKIPLVMIHGVAGGILTFYKIYSHFTVDRCVYGIDLPGFALSSRVSFPNHPDGCEEKMVDMIEQWRKEMKLERIILMGHSFGGFVSAVYAQKYYAYIDSLVLIEPWGVFPEETAPSFGSVILRTLMKTFQINPLQGISNLGILGKPLLGCFSAMTADEKEGYGVSCLNYLMRATLLQDATGSKAFTVISNYTFKYPTRPLKDSLREFLQKVSLPITFIYGDTSTFYKLGRDYIAELQQQTIHKVTLKVFEGARHHVQVQRANELAEFICQYVLNKDSETSEREQCN